MFSPIAILLEIQAIWSISRCFGVAIDMHLGR